MLLNLSDWISKSGPTMMGYLSDYMNSRLMQELLDTEGIEIDKLWLAINEILDQAFIEKASWGLPLWEKEWGLTPEPEDTIEMRRSRILGRIAGAGSFTEQAAINLANAYSLTRSARYIPLYSEYTFKTAYELDDLVSYSGLRAAFDVLKPAHLLHIVSLLISMQSDFHVQAAAKVIGKAIVDLSPMVETSVRWKLLYQFLGFGLLDYDPSNLVFNGLWDFDGSQFFNGIFNQGIYRYLEASMPCSIRLLQRVDLLFSKVTTLTTIKSKTQVQFQSMDASIKYKVPLFFLGVGKYDDIDPDALLFNGAWQFDGSFFFDGINPKALALYLDAADSCNVRHYRNGEIIEEEIL